MGNTYQQIEKWAADHRIRPFAVWLSVYMGFRRLPEPYFSQHLCNLIDRVWALYRITQYTRYAEIQDPTVLHILKLYKEIRKYSNELLGMLDKATPHLDTQLDILQYASFMSYEKNSKQTSPLWKLVNARERLRCLTNVALGEAYPYSDKTYTLVGGGVGEMVRSYVQQTNMQNFISDIDGRFLCCDVGGIVPPQIYELTAAFGMTQLPEPYATLQATTMVQPNPSSKIATTSRFLHDCASAMTLKLHIQLSGAREYNNRTIVEFYLPDGAAMAKLNDLVRVLREEIQHTHGLLLPLCF